MKKDGIKFELNKAGVGQLLKSREMMSVLQSEARKSGYQVEDSFVGYNRCKLKARGGK